MKRSSFFSSFSKCEKNVVSTRPVTTTDIVIHSQTNAPPPITSTAMTTTEENDGVICSGFVCPQCFITMNDATTLLEHFQEMHKIPTNSSNMIDVNKVKKDDSNKKECEEENMKRLLNDQYLIDHIIPSTSPPSFNPSDCHPNYEEKKNNNNNNDDDDDESHCDYETNEEVKFTNEKNSIDNWRMFSYFNWKECESLKRQNRHLIYLLQKHSKSSNIDNNNNNNSNNCTTANELSNPLLSSDTGYNESDISQFTKSLLTDDQMTDMDLQLQNQKSTATTASGWSANRLLINRTNSIDSIQLSEENELNYLRSKLFEKMGNDINFLSLDGEQTFSEYSNEMERELIILNQSNDYLVNDFSSQFNKIEERVERLSEDKLVVCNDLKETKRKYELLVKKLEDELRREKGSKEEMKKVLNDSLAVCEKRLNKNEELLEEEMKEKEQLNQFVQQLTSKLDVSESELFTTQNQLQINQRQLNELKEKNSHLCRTTSQMNEHESIRNLYQNKTIMLLERLRDISQNISLIDEEKKELSLQLIDLKLLYKNSIDNERQSINEKKNIEQRLKNFKNERDHLKVSLCIANGEQEKYRKQIDETMDDLKEWKKGFEGLQRENEILKKCVAGEVHWMENDVTDNCLGCRKQFNLSTRKHHCRLCGRIFCGDCTIHSTTIGKKMLRICRRCQSSLYNSKSEEISKNS
ncbi:hypothetical protein SNEBB_011190 [Seison nebaliae]|nr:hypothetical protein SNEBB_011190 [Seison nebaliae]